MTCVCVVGATGMVGRRVVGELRRSGHDVVEVSRRHGVDVERDGSDGLGAVLAGTEVVIDVLNTHEQEVAAARSFFARTTEHLSAARRPSVAGSLPTRATTKAPVSKHRGPCAL